MQQLRSQLLARLAQAHPPEIDRSHDTYWLGHRLDKWVATGLPTVYPEKLAIQLCVDWSADGTVAADLVLRRFRKPQNGPKPRVVTARTIESSPVEHECRFKVSIRAGVVELALGDHKVTAPEADPTAILDELDLIIMEYFAHVTVPAFVAKCAARRAELQASQERCARRARAF